MGHQVSSSGGQGDLARAGSEADQDDRDRINSDQGLLINDWGVIRQIRDNYHPHGNDYK